jgi:hypothetical protein
MAHNETRDLQPRVRGRRVHLATVHLRMPSLTPRAAGTSVCARTISLSLNVLAKSLFLLGCLGDPSPGAKTPWTGGCRAMWSGRSEGMAVQMQDRGGGGGK